MKRLTKRAGLTTMEVAVASTVMVGVVYMSFDVMLKSVKVSAGAMQATQTNDDLRTGMDSLINSIRTADMVLSTHTADQTVDTSKENLLIKKPVFNALGNRIANQSQVVWYYYQSTSDKKKKPGIIYARTSTINGSTIGNFSAPREIVYNVEKVTWTYRYMAQVRVASAGITVPLNFNASSSGASATNAQIIKMKSSAIGLNVDVPGNVGVLPPVAANVVTLPGLAQAGTVIDIEAKVDPRYAPLAGGGSLINIVDMKVKFKKEQVDGESNSGSGSTESEGEVKRNESYSITLQNFKG
ncbi:MAG: hypothetical protein KDC26_01285 [Armatimonadetes bacterium]|nr:hypothetical protein [Armatimonadota bacterium]